MPELTATTGTTKAIRFTSLADLIAAEETRQAAEEIRQLLGESDSNDPYSSNDLYSEGITEEQATRLLLRLAAKKREIEVLKIQYQKLLTERTRNLAQFESWITPQLEAFATAALEKSKGRSKTVKLFGGDLSFRKVKESWSVKDEAKTIGDIRSICPGAIVQVEKLDKKALWSQLGELEPMEDGTVLHKATGGIIEGIAYTPEHESFSISTPDKTEQETETK